MSFMWCLHTACRPIFELGRYVDTMLWSGFPLQRPSNYETFSILAIKSSEHPAYRRNRSCRSWTGSRIHRQSSSRHFADSSCSPSSRPKVLRRIVCTVDGSSSTCEHALQLAVILRNALWPAAASFRNIDWRGRRSVLGGVS
jgi:hypothetical protein